MEIEYETFYKYLLTIAFYDKQVARYQTVQHEYETTIKYTDDEIMNDVAFRVQRFRPEEKAQCLKVVRYTCEPSVIFETEYLRNKNDNW